MRDLPCIPLKMFRLRKKTDRILNLYFRLILGTETTYNNQSKMKQK